MSISPQTTFYRFLLAGLIAGSALAGGTPRDRAALVNPLIGTANGGNVFPGATMPFGMVQFSPEATPINTKRMIAAPGGYEHRATKIRGFSLTNVEGWGCAGGSGDVPFMPITDAVENSPIRLSDGTVITTPGALAPGVTLQTYDVSLAALDLSYKYHGLGLSTELYFQELLLSSRA